MSWIEVPSVSIFKHFNITELEIDQAWVNVSSLAGVPLWLYELSTDCHRCPYQRKGSISEDEIYKFKISTMHPMKYRFRTEGSAERIPEDDKYDSAKFCDLEYNFGEFGVYDIFTNGNSAGDGANCGVNVLLEPVNIYLPLLIAVLFYIVLAFVVLLTTTYHKKVRNLFGFKTSSSTSSKTEINPPDTNDVHRTSSATPIPTNGNAFHVNAYSPSPTTQVTISTITSIPTSAESEKPESPSSVRRTSNAHANANANNDSNSNQKSQSQNLHHQQSTSSTAQQQPSTPKPRQRLRSLDTFRGYYFQFNANTAF